MQYYTAAVDLLLLVVGVLPIPVLIALRSTDFNACSSRYLGGCLDNETQASTLRLP